MRILIMVLGLSLLVGCASTPELKMVPTAEHGVGVRFARGQAMMVSNGRAGSVVVFPVRFNNGSLPFFAVGGFNLSGQPINFGVENVRVRLDDGAYLPVKDFDRLREEAKSQAQRELSAASVLAAFEGLRAFERHQDSPNRFEIAYRRAAGDFYASQAVIEARLIGTIRERGRVVLQTTTIDPGTTYGGAIFADHPALAQGQVRTMDVEVNFGGELHAFRIALAPSGTPSPVPEGIPAVPRQQVRAIQTAPQTWMWDGPPPPPGRQIIH